MPADSPWPRTAAPVVAGKLRAAPEDFAVEERMDIPLSGAGEHVWLKVRKRGVNTEDVARALARAAGVPRRAVGYAGMKDRHAVATQWFSVQLPGREPPPWPETGAIQVLEATRHARKLQTGALAGNRFTLVLRDCQGKPAALAARVTALRAQGVPNYFGEQRFGRNQENITRARAMFSGERVTETATGASLHRGPRLAPIGDRHRRGIYLSAARSFLFNTVLARRVADGSWNRALEGEAFILDGRRSFFLDDGTDTTLAERLTAGDIHPSGPLWGRGELSCRGAARALEEAVVQAHPDLSAGLAAAGLEQERRALRVFVRDLAACWLDAASLELAFFLPAGCYATAVLRELADYRDVAGEI